ncbi:MAG TPA: hypothetical protein VHO06_14870 [Polyangia bacterium]|nr:hypothetical protein [Polyangia bacterium]
MPAGSGLAADFVFLRSAKNATAQVSRAEVKAFYTAKAKTWKSGLDVTILLNAPGSPEFKWLAEVIGAPEEVVLAKIKQEVFRGEMRKPETVATPAECVEALKRIDGGICLVDAASAKSLPAGVAVLGYSGG